MWRRLVQHSLSLGLGQGLNLLHQLLVPVAFLREYGASGYGAWLVVLAAAGQLGNLDFGLQTYLGNRLTMLHAAGELAEFRRLQAIGLCVTLATCAAGFLCLFVGLVVPVAQWLKLDWPPGEARLVVLLLGTWVLLRLLNGQFAASLRALGQPHRAQHWENLQRGLLLASTLGLVATRSGFVWLAAAHVAVALLCLAVQIIDLRAAGHAPNLHAWDRADALAMLRPSLFCGLASLNFLALYEIPLLILQWTLGPVAVVTFATTRTLFSAARQLLTPIQLALQQELPRTLGNATATQLLRLYQFSELVALAGGGALITGVALASPWLLHVWLGDRVEPSNLLLALMAAATLATILKDNQFALPLATNRHEHATLAVSAGYLAMAGIGGWLAEIWREPGLLAAWLLTELVLLAWLRRRNYAANGWGKPPYAWLALALPLTLGAGLFSALSALTNTAPLLRLACATASALAVTTVVIASSGHQGWPPVRRFCAVFSGCRSEG